MKPNESVEDAIARELGRRNKGLWISTGGYPDSIVNTRTSPSYPVFPHDTQKIMHNGIIPPSMYRVSYEETQDGVTSHFSWVEA